VDLVDSTALVESLGDYRAAELFARCDSIARNLLAHHDGTEIDKTDGYLLIFDRPIDAVKYTLKLHEALVGLSEESNTKLVARAGIHLGEIVLRRNPPQHVARGAKPLEVEGLAKPVAARLMSLAQGAQTLLTRAAFDLARRAAEDEPDALRSLQWINHGAYCFKGIDEAQAVCEVGLKGISPLSSPTSCEKAWRVTDHEDEDGAGWRPTAGQTIPKLHGWTLERRLGGDSAEELWLARPKMNETHAETIGLDASIGQARKGQVRAFLFFRAEGVGDDPDGATTWRLSGCVSCVAVASGNQQGAYAILTEKPLVGGRESATDMQIDDPRVSRKHFEILRVDDRYWIRELQSRNGVFVNGEGITGEQKLQNTDKIGVGKTHLVFYEAG